MTNSMPTALRFAVFAFVCGACSSSPSSPIASDAAGSVDAIDATTPADGSGAPETTSDADVGIEIGIDVDASIADVAPPLPTPPTFACTDAGTADATVAIDATITDAASLDPECPLPPSVCASDGQWLVYYSGGTCSAGTCQFTAHEMKCEIACFSGGCGIPFTH
ncbi:MAG: hypothetical protein ACHREM_11360 [Polyangiales bacterium]